MEYFLVAVFIGFILDLVFGDPVFFVHPIRLMGILIEKGEKCLEKLPLSRPFAQFAAGVFLSVLVLGLSFLVPFLLLHLANIINPGVRFLLEAFFCYQIFAVKSLKTESMKVYEALIKKDIDLARQMLSYIVGRDTSNLNEEQIANGAVETVAENTADGIIAPMLFMMIGGAPLGFLYKAINTLDSMIGYKNDKYQYFGKFAARLDDLANFIPSRLTAGFMMMAAFLCKFNGKEAIRIFRRDRYNHKSPNSAQTEAVCAGALGIQLGGANYYFGKLVDKDTIGDAQRRTEPEDIKRANQLMMATSLLGMIVFALTWVVLLLLQEM